MVDKVGYDLMPNVTVCPATFLTYFSNSKLHFEVNVYITSPLGVLRTEGGELGWVLPMDDVLWRFAT